MKIFASLLLGLSTLLLVAIYTAQASSYGGSPGGGSASDQCTKPYNPPAPTEP